MKRDPVFRGHWSRVWVIAGALESFFRPNLEGVAAAGPECIRTQALHHGVHVEVIHAHSFKVPMEKGALDDLDIASA